MVEPTHYPPTPAPYRTAAPLAIVKNDEPRGPVMRCPVCADDRRFRWHHEQHNPNERGRVVAGPTIARACRGTARVWQWLLGSCARPDMHLHQRCTTCGARWECAPAFNG